MKNNKNSNNENNNQGNYALMYLIISIGIAVVAGGIVAKLVEGGGFITFIIVAGVVGYILINILVPIGRSKDIQNQLVSTAKKIMDQGIDIEESYVSPNGNGIIIDRKAKKIVLIHKKLGEPFTLPFSLIKECEMYEDISEEIAYSEDGYTGVIIGRSNPDSEVAKRMKESAEYGPRKINRYYRQLGVTIACNNKGVIKRYDIDYIDGKLLVDNCDEIKRLVIDAVDNVKSAIKKK